MIGYVPQETLLLHDTVWINVTLGDSSLREKDVEDALRAAGAWDFVTAPCLRAWIAPSANVAANYPAGSARRIAIARALVHKPKLLILDEATSALDPESEMAIGHTLQKLRGNLTIVAISHQPALMKAADRAYRSTKRDCHFSCR